MEEDKGVLPMVFLKSLVWGQWHHCEKHLLPGISLVLYQYKLPQMFLHLF